MSDEVNVKGGKRRGFGGMFGDVDDELLFFFLLLVIFFNNDAWLIGEMIPYYSSSYC